MRQLGDGCLVVCKLLQAEKVEFQLKLKVDDDQG